MGQDGEEAAEMLATMKGEHVAMKSWYNGPSESAECVRAKYGATYPAFWRDVINWPAWKDARKAYLAFTEGKPDNAADSAPRKRRSRWSTSQDDANANASCTGAHADGSAASGSEPARRKSRWSRDGEETRHPAPTAAESAVAAALNPASLPPSASSVVQDLLPGLPANLSHEQQLELTDLQARLRVANEKLANLEAEAARVDALPYGHRDRSPSPPPQYGVDGKRKNTRAVRWRERYTSERQDCLEKIMDLNPSMRPAAGFPKRKRSRKIYIPVDEHPTYNFIGLIIGPRGKTQKDMENKTGCKIAIRGKGSIKEGARGRRDGKPLDGDDDPLHVVVTGDDQPSVDAAAEMITHMLIVIDDDQNIHKQQQLRELALLNGTLKDEEFCQLCAEKGHRSFECPKRFSSNGKAAINVKCAICGDTSHPTRDCAQKPTEHRDEKQLDSDYLSFMAELDGRSLPPKSAECAAADSVEVGAGNDKGVPLCQSVNDGGQPITAPSASGVTTISKRKIILNNDGTPALPDTEIVPPVTSTSTPSLSTSLTLPPLKPPTTGLPPPPISLPPPPAGLPPPLTGLPPSPAGPPPHVVGSPTISEFSAPASLLSSSMSGLSSIPPPPPPSTDPSHISLPPPLGHSLPYYHNSRLHVSNAVPPLPPPVYPQYGQQQPYNPQQFGQQLYGNLNPYNGYPPAPHYQQQQQYTDVIQNVGIGSGVGPQPSNSQNQHEDTEGWDYRSYFGSEPTGGDAGGAGGFNWWEAS